MENVNFPYKRVTSTLFSELLPWLQLLIIILMPLRHFPEGQLPAPSDGNDAQALWGIYRACGIWALVGHTHAQKRETQVQIQVLPVPGCVILSRWLSLSVPGSFSDVLSPGQATAMRIRRSFSLLLMRVICIPGLTKQKSPQWPCPHHKSKPKSA